MDCSTPGPPVHHLPEFAQTHVHWVSDAIQPSHPLLPPSSFALQSFPASGFFPKSQLFASGGQSIGASTSASVLPINIQGWWIFIGRTDARPILSLPWMNAATLQPPHHIDLCYIFQQSPHLSSNPTRCPPAQTLAAHCFYNKDRPCMGASCWPLLWAPPHSLQLLKWPPFLPPQGLCRCCLFLLECSHFQFYPPPTPFHSIDLSSTSPPQGSPPWSPNWIRYPLTHL